MPEHLLFGYVKGTLIRTRGDGSDGDRYPDVVGATDAKVTFTRQGGPVVASNPPRIVSHAPVLALVMPDGQITGDLKGSNIAPDAVPGVWLVVGTYKVSTSNFFPDFTIVVTPEHTLEAPLDLAVAAGVPTPPAGATLRYVTVPTGSSPGQALVATETGFGWAPLPDGGTSGSLDVEAVQDAVATMLTEGTGVTLDYDDGAGTLTITATAGGGSEPAIITSPTQPTETDVLWVGPDHEHLADPLDATGQPDGVVPTAQGDGTWAWAEAPGGVQDTGARNVTYTGNTVDFYVTWGEIYLQRWGSLVTVSVLAYAKAWASGTSAERWIAPIPVGFRPAGGAYGALSGGNGNWLLYAESSLRTTAPVGTPLPTDGMQFAGSVTYLTPDPWPTTLPGAPA